MILQHLLYRFSSCPLLSVVLRPHQRAGIWLHYPEGFRAEGWRPPYQLQAQGLADFKAEILGHTHPRSALWVLWSSCCPWGGVTSYITKDAISQRKGCVATGGCSRLGELQVSQVRTRFIKKQTNLRTGPNIVCAVGIWQAWQIIAVNTIIYFNRIINIDL